MLDSSPVALPPPPRPLKRSASVASLPTPPRTRHRTENKRGRSRGSLESDSDGDSIGGVSTDNSGDEAGRNGSEIEERVNVHKRRRTASTLDDEDAFWLGEGRAGGSEDLKRGRGSGLRKSGSFKARAVASDPEPETTHRDVPLLYQRLLADEVKREKTKAASASATPVEPVSPPPSNRKVTRVVRSPGSITVSSIHTSPAVPVRSPPVTPRPQNKGKKRLQRTLELPVRDSPNNPFLDSPSDGSQANPPRIPTPLEERPTITYVFRGVRGVYPNPLYNHAKKRALTPPPKSFLPPEHPDYSPDMRCPPRLLFPTRPSKAHKRNNSSVVPTTPTRDRTNTKDKGRRKENFSNLPKMKDVVLGSGPKGRRSQSPYETFGESDDEDGSSVGEEDTDLFCGIKPMKLDFGVKVGEGSRRGGTSLADRDGTYMAPRVRH